MGRALPAAEEKKCTEFSVVSWLVCWPLDPKVTGSNAAKAMDL
jgi:hypothetical protein